MGRRAGPLGLFDIDGGPLEIAVGRGRLSDSAASLPLGASGLTREYLDDLAPPTAEAVHVARRAVRHQPRDVAARCRWESVAAHHRRDVTDVPAACPASRARGRTLTICRWAVREGILLQRIEGGAPWCPHSEPGAEPAAARPPLRSGRRVRRFAVGAPGTRPASNDGQGPPDRSRPWPPRERS
ncbi:hypothetical protein [Streptomyces sp. NPDC050504]|uniref:Ppx/GppA phosphatase family protein n=1 Tax=Streptomyces sp. NPDC050504 TaxID=3365618 RepID=UPI00378AFF74